MPARSEDHELGRIVRGRLPLGIRLFQSCEVDKNRRRARVAGQRRDRRACLRYVSRNLLHDLLHGGSNYDTGHGVACQISAAYSAMVRSLENLPELATLRIALRAHASGSAESAGRWPSASRWAARAARGM